MRNAVGTAISQTPVDQINTGIPAAGAKGTAADLEKRIDAIKNLAVVRRASSPWLGGQYVPATKEDVLPAIFNEPYTLEFGEGKVSLAVVAARLTKITGVPVRVRSDVYGIASSAIATPRSPASNSNSDAANAANGSLQSRFGSLPALMQGSPLPAAAPALLPPSAVSSFDTITLDGVSMRWSSGKLRDFLDHLTNVLNLSWEYRDGSVVILKMLTQTHTISAMVGQQAFTLSLGSASSGSAGAGSSTSSMQSSSSFAEKGMIDGFESAVETIKAMAGNSAGTTVIANTQTGGITVTASKDVQAQIRDYVEDQNKLLRRMVNVQLDVYSVVDTDNDAQGINWNIVYKAMVGDYGIGINSPASIVGSGVSAVTLSGYGADSEGSRLILNALRSTGKSVTHKPVSLHSMNGKFKVQSNTATQGFVKSTTPGPASSTGVGAPGLNTDIVTTGDIFEVLPIVQSDNSVLLKYAFRMSNLLEIKNFTSGSGTSAQTVQVPQTADVGDGGDIRLMPGEAVMITGLSRIATSGQNARVAEGASMGLGGSDSNVIKREHFVVLLRATPL
jgi:type IVB pilus formation R64 PilN family outer membrane protein